MIRQLLEDVPTGLWIGGQWRDGSDRQRFDVVDPATEAVIASVASGSPDDAKTAIDAADSAAADWAGRLPRERSEILRRAFELFSAQSERFAKLITLENGKALPDSRGEVAYAAESSAGFQRRACGISVSCRRRRPRARASWSSTRLPALLR